MLATTGDHVSAAGIANVCRTAGIATSTPDCLIAAQTIERGASLFATDGDFYTMAPHVGLRLHRFVDR